MDVRLVAQGQVGVELKQFPAGLYAVAACQVQMQEGEDPGQVIPTASKRLAAWCEDHNYRFASHQWLEEHTLHDEDVLSLELYCPIAK